MTLQQVPTIRTAVSDLDFIKCLASVWKKAYGSFPTKQQAGVIFSQWSLETGKKDCWNYNICNIKAHDVEGEIITYCALNGVWEMVNGQRVELKPTDPGSWFRAFPTLEDGMQFYFDFLRGKRYASAWGGVLKGSPQEFVHLLKLHGYFTADENEYLNGVLYHYNAYLKSNTFETALSELNTPAPTIEQTEPNMVKINQEQTNTVTLPLVKIIGNPTFWEKVFVTLRKVINFLLHIKNE